tara:strand:- start:33 stop:260 length:228 start_codon:yes stop_codon:yes gene_type:complete
MKHLIKTLFFGYLPLGWKRLLRVATFGWVAFFVVNFILTYPYNIDDDIFGIILVIVVSMILSYVISGFIKQKKTP